MEMCYTYKELVPPHSQGGISLLAVHHFVMPDRVEALPPRSYQTV